MELTDIMALVKAGYTKEEISQMESLSKSPVPATPAPAPAPAPVPAEKETPAPAPVAPVVPVAPAVPAPAPAPVPAPTPVQTQEQPTMADIMQGIAKLTSAVQANAIAQSVIPQGLQNPPSAEDMLAEIIRPTYGGKKDA